MFGAGVAELEEGGEMSGWSSGVGMGEEGLKEGGGFDIVGGVERRGRGSGTQASIPPNDISHPWNQTRRRRRHREPVQGRRM